MFPTIKLIKHIEFVNLFCYVADEEMDIVLCDIEARMTEEFREGHDVSTIEDPLFGKGVAVTVDTRCLHASTLVIFIEHMIARAFRELLTEYVAKQIIVICLILSIFQILR